MIPINGGFDGSLNIDNDVATILAVVVVAVAEVVGIIIAAVVNIHICQY